LQSVAGLRVFSGASGGERSFDIESVLLRGELLRRKIIAGTNADFRRARFFFRPKSRRVRSGFSRVDSSRECGYENAFHFSRNFFS
jgi:hypothetical protein